ncbi:MAG: cyclase family protein [Crocinitomicaceae bacterium]
MKLHISANQWIETSEGHDISLPLSPRKGPLAWYVDPVKIWPVKTDEFVGKVSEGGSTNFNNIQLNPHGNGTHTENVGHISESFYNINDSLTEFFFNAKLISVCPKKIYNTRFNENDLVIDSDLLRHEIEDIGYNQALIIRTLPNSDSKLSINYSNSNPPYITKDAIEFIIDIGIKHLLIDLPSIDRENDHGELLAHKIFWNYPTDPELDKTITELVYVKTELPDGNYILNIQIISIENDASPSKPILYKIKD